ncbi:hypothetical protein MKZ38_000660 [Zalerion maritima]|uniref:Ammonium transporter AmtB-like domain-containing protein n=1 Tax=Zalerion maritima TaxID=339359 RepID=A0AAD5WSE1_9PEZI|nr:hypothetical protein MKZ38_000660 [Zalerion maritima]
MEPTRYSFNVTWREPREVTPTLDEISQNPGLYYQAGDIAWVLTATALVYLMIIGLSLFYAGISQPRTSLSMAWLPLMTAALISVQWFLWGYSIAFSNWGNSSNYWGGTSGFALHDALLRPVPATRNSDRDGPYIPEILYALFEMVFAAFTGALVSGSAAFKERPGHFLVFILFWTTFVYDPIARWTWNADGWPSQLGWHPLDFAGGSPVHICAAFTVLAHCLYHLHIFPRISHGMGGPKVSSHGHDSDDLRDIPTGGAPALPDIPPAGGHVPPPPSHPKANTQPHNCQTEESAANYILVILGTMFLWLGWFGFNGGSALGSSVRAVTAVVNTHLAASTGGVSHVLISAYISRRQRKKAGSTSADSVDKMNDGRGNGRRPFIFSLVDFANGAIIGLVTVTPAAGYIPVTISPVFGFLPVLICIPLYRVSELIEDYLFIFVIHGVGGVVGMLLTGVFARGDIAELDGFTKAEDANGAWGGYGMQILIQLTDAVVTAAYSFFFTMVLLILLDVLGFALRKIVWRQAGEDRKIGTSQVLVEESTQGAITTSTTEVP